jgi:hypothetical protein
VARRVIFWTLRAPLWENRAMKGADKPKHVAKKKAQKSLKEKRAAKKMAAKQQNHHGLDV